MVTYGEVVWKSKCRAGMRASKDVQLWWIVLSPSRSYFRWQHGEKMNLRVAAATMETIICMVCVLLCILNVVYTEPVASLLPIRTTSNDRVKSLKLNCEAGLFFYFQDSSTRWNNRGATVSGEARGRCQPSVNFKLPSRPVSWELDWLIGASTPANWVSASRHHISFSTCLQVHSAASNVSHGALGCIELWAAKQHFCIQRGRHWYSHHSISGDNRGNPLPRDKTVSGTSEYDRTQWLI